MPFELSPPRLSGQAGVSAMKNAIHGFMFYIKEAFWGNFAMLSLTQKSSFFFA